MTDKKRLECLKKFYRRNEIPNILRGDIDMLLGVFTVAVSGGSAERRGCRNGKTARLYETLQKPIEEHEYKLTFDEILVALSSAQGKFYFEERELTSVLSVAAIIILRRLFQNPADSGLISNMSFTVREIRGGSFERLIKAVSEVDFILRGRCVYYEKSDSATKTFLRAKISRLAEIEKKDEYYIAEKYAADIGRVKVKNEKFFGRMYFIFNIFGTILIFLPIAITLIFTSLIESSGDFYSFVNYGVPVFSKSIRVILASVISVLLILPVSELVRILSDGVFSSISANPIPAYDMNAGIPDEGKTVVVITTLLFGKKNDSSLFRQLEKYYIGNRDTNGNIIFGLLADLPDSAELIDEGDISAIKYARAKINALNSEYGGGFCLFIRHRVNDDDGRYTAWERKRGAVLELTRLIAGMKTTFDCVIADGDFLKNAKYIITLDGDTSLPIGSAKKMIGAMLHPLNKPIIENGRVKYGHAILQPRISPTSASVGQTPFAVLQNGAGGTELYSTASYDTYQSLFDEGSFCGKGIIDATVFRLLLDGKFPEKTILSHDLLEGSVLRSGLISSVTLSDTTPKNSLSFNARLHRWIRGDVQVCKFVDKKLNMLSNFKLCDNIRRELVPVCSAAAMLLSFSLGEKSVTVIALSSTLYIFVPMLRAIVYRLSTLPLRIANDTHIIHSASRISIEPSGIIGFVLYELSTLAEKARITLDAMIRSIWRINISHKKLLEWTTAAEADKKSAGLSDYLGKMSLSLFFGMLFMILPFTVLRIIGVMWFISPFFCYLLGNGYEENKSGFSEKEEKNIRKSVKKMWAFFEKYASDGDNYLPPDNVSFIRDEKIAHRTSPTNIGLYLLSSLCARDFALIDSRELFERLDKSVYAVEKLTKWNGHLYNWYDTVNLSILSPYISTVDSGNFIASIITLRHGIADYIGECPHLALICSRLDKIIDGTDFSFLYDKERELFHTGFNSADNRYDCGYYDLLMSESRITSFVSIGKGDVPAEHFGKLGRPLASEKGRLGVLSWSGTAFEYFMPSLFIAPMRDTLEYEALCYAAEIQSDTKCHGFFGKSEGCYFSFNRESDYLYRAFGVSDLAISCEYADSVITPYASFLMLPFIPKKVCENLKKLNKLGADGNYGFYESVDFSKSRVGNGYAIIKSYMSHHLGMSIISAANALFDGICQKRFIRDIGMDSARCLLDERVPIGETIITRKKSYEKKKIAGRHSFSYDVHGNGEKKIAFPSAALISNGRLRLVATAKGQIELSNGNKKVTHPILSGFPKECYSVGRKYDISVSPDSASSISVFAFCDGNTITTQDESTEFAYSLDTISFTAKNRKYAFRTEYRMDSDSNALKIRLKARGDFSEITPVIYFEPCLAVKEEYEAHPCFSLLSIESEYLPNDKILVFRRRSRKGEKCLCLAVGFSGDGEIEFETVRRNILPMKYNFSDIVCAAGEKLRCNDGVCIDPCALIKKKSFCRNGIYSEEIFIAVGESENECVEIISLLRRNNRHDERCGFGKSAASAASLHGSDIKILEIILSSIYGNNKKVILHSDMNEDILWRYGISGDNPIVFADIPSGGLDEIVCETLCAFLRCIHYLFLCGYLPDFVIMLESSGEYQDEGRDTVKRLISDCGCDFLLEKDGGIFIIEAQKDEKTKLCEVYSAISEFSFALSPGTSPENLIAEIYNRYIPVDSVKRKTVNECPVDAIAKYKIYETHFDFDKAGVRRPWSYVYVGKSFGTLVTQNSLGYTWFCNCHEMRLTPWTGDSLADFSGESILYLSHGRENDLVGMSEAVSYRDGYAIYRGKIDGDGYTVSVGVDEKLPVKLISVDMLNGDYSKIRFEFLPDVKSGGAERIDCGDTVYAVYHRGGMRGYTAFAKNNGDGSFLFGCFPTDANPANHGTFLKITEKYPSKSEIEKEFSRGKNKYRTGITLQSGCCELDSLFNHFLVWQNNACRFRARTGYYQSGGAYGFRDQLQDCLALIYSEPDAVRRHIIRCAARQYIEGDVMHWWHDSRNGVKGIRSRCSDDALWLVFVTAEYCTKTGDYSVLRTDIPYLSSPLLAENEKERYESPKFDFERKEPLYLHLMRCFDKIKYGNHGLPLIGSGDWNDGMNFIGWDEKNPESKNGESVWLAMFTVLVINKLLPVCKHTEDDISSVRLREIKKKLVYAIEEHCYTDDDGGYYLRAFYGDGSSLGNGVNGGDGCRIDILPQAFSVMLDGALDRNRSDAAVCTMYNRLYDSENGLVKLFTPPFDRDEIFGKNRPGYICGYPNGVRENGGQYTHAAIWAAWALFLTGDCDKAFRIMLDIAPVLRDNKILGTEPYALCGDISTAAGHIGEGGWSLYTGSAGWYYKLILEMMIGYSECGNGFKITPRIPEDYEGFFLKTDRHDTVYEISVRRVAGKNKKTEYILDGEIVNNYFSFDKKSHFLEISVVN